MIEARVSRHDVVLYRHAGDGPLRGCARLYPRAFTTDTISIMIQWTPALSTGVVSLDEQHQQIFQWLTELENATLDERTLFGVYAITRLNRYMREHFAEEEAMMKRAAYPDLARHILEHAEFRAKLGELQIKSISEDISMDTVKFLQTWLTRHITKTDMAYVPYLKPEKTSEKTPETH